MQLEQELAAISGRLANIEEHLCTLTLALNKKLDALNAAGPFGSGTIRFVRMDGLKPQIADFTVTPTSTFTPPR